MDHTEVKVEIEVEEDECRFTNFYRHCGTKWEDTWSCMCNNECSVCGGEIEPYDSIDHRAEETDEDCPVYGNPDHAHLYQMGTDKGIIQVHGNTRGSASKIARECGYTVRDCNMIG